MSASTRSSARDFARVVAIALIALAAGAAAAGDAPKGPSLPPTVAAALPHVKMVGGAEMRFLGLSIYDGFYWSPARSASATNRAGVASIPPGNTYCWMKSDCVR